MILMVSAACDAGIASPVITAAEVKTPTRAPTRLRLLSFIVLLLRVVISLDKALVGPG
jgi:hypothetical protein